MKSRSTIIFAAASGMLAVMLGAFGAHALRETLQTSGHTGTYETAVQYHFYHTLALLATGLLMPHYSSIRLQYASLCFAGGIVLFSGSLYALCLTNITSLGIITPFGGVLFIAGWLLMLLGIYSKK